MEGETSAGVAAVVIIAVVVVVGVGGGGGGVVEGCWLILPYGVFCHSPQVESLDVPR